MKILFFASLREQLNTEEERWKDLNGALTAGDVLSQLQTRGEPWSSSLNAERLLVSVNQEISNLTTKVTLDDELAFFPPVTGG